MNVPTLTQTTVPLHLHIFRPIDRYPNAPNLVRGFSAEDPLWTLPLPEIWGTHILWAMGYVGACRDTLLPRTQPPSRPHFLHIFVSFKPVETMAQCSHMYICIKDIITILRGLNPIPTQTQFVTACTNVRLYRTQNVSTSIV